MGGPADPDPGSDCGSRAPTRRGAPADAPGFPIREGLLLCLVMAATVLALLGVLWLGTYALSGIRSYVHGEAMFSRAQKDAVVALQDYAVTGDEADWRRYEAAMALPLAGGRAWRLLASGDAPSGAVREALLDAGHHPDDVGSVMGLFSVARWGREMRAGVEVGLQADALARELDATARRLRAEMHGPGWSLERARALLAPVSELNAALTHLENEFSRLMADGTRRVSRWVLATTSLIAVALLGAGLGGSMRLLRRVRRRESRFRSVIENTSDIVSILDEGGRVLYLSRSIERMLGYDADQLVGTDGFALIHPDDRPALEASLTEHVQDPLATLRASEYRCRHADGSWRTLASTAGLYEDEDGARRIVVTSRDITLQRALEARLAEASRLESVGRLAGGVSHDFNNLLTAILGAAEAAQLSIPPDSPAGTELSEIVAATGRAADLTRQLLAFARRQPVEPEVFDLAEDLRHMEPILRRLIGERIELSVAATGEPARVRADRSQIEQVMLNLAVNARDAMPDGGRLRIAVSRQRLDRETAERETGGDRGPYVVLEVSDSGVAMDPEVLERIFEPFFTTKADTHGTGLGLATTWGIVKQSGGFVTVTSERGRGSCFRVHLPECDRPATTAIRRPAAGGAAEPEASPAVPGGETLLLVEDHPEVRKLTARALRQRGYAVVEVADGAEALRWAEGHLDEADLLVSDVVMPRVSGPTLAAHLRQRRPDLPVLFVSGYAAEEDTLLLDGRTVCLQKPVRSARLARCVRALLDAATPARPAGGDPSAGTRRAPRPPAREAPPTGEAAPGR